MAENSFFAPPVGGKNGTFIWPYIKGPKFFNSDLAIYKTLTINERQRIEFRFSAFNFCFFEVGMEGRPQSRTFFVPCHM